ncbi:MAG: helix-turn-helix transcriptional regulator [Bacteroidales bacterium]|nr:helix-turn-helix transcriptional regulator [Bacteroidales bacterium]
MIKDRLLKFIAMENISSTQFADAIGVQRSTVSHLLSGRNNPSYDFIVKILNHSKYLSADWLICGIGPMYRQKDNSINDIFSQAVAASIEEETKETPVNQTPASPVAPEAQTEVSQNTSEETLNGNSTISRAVTSESDDKNTENVLAALSGATQPRPAVQLPVNNAGKTIRRIVIFYDDHSMDIYEQ